MPREMAKAILTYDARSSFDRNAFEFGGRIFLVEIRAPIGRMPALGERGPP